MVGMTPVGTCRNVTFACHFDRRLEQIMMSRRDYFRRLWFSSNPQLTTLAGMIMAIAPLELCYVISACALASDLYVGNSLLLLLTIGIHTSRFICVLSVYVSLFTPNPTPCSLVTLSIFSLSQGLVALSSSVPFADVRIPSSTAKTVFATLLAIDYTVIALLLFRKRGALVTLNE
ncbi:Uncharacterized protein PBTT_09706 [Plasmodiophora brassicae]